jgi:hypothetical protein
MLGNLNLLSFVKPVLSENNTINRIFHVKKRIGILHGREGLDSIFEHSDGVVLRLNGSGRSGST